MFPETAKLEQMWNQLRNDYETFKTFEKSEELSYYENLEKEVNSPEFNLRIKEIKARNFKKTDEFHKEQEFLRLKKSKPIVTYFNVLNSDNLREFEVTEKSPELKRYRELGEYMRSDSFIKEKASMNSKDFKNSEAGLKEKEFQDASKSALITNFLKFEKSADYREYLRVKDSEELRKYTELEKTINSEEFLKIKNYMALSAKEKYEASDEFKKVQEYQLLKKSDKITWFYKTKKKYPFKYVEKWELSFEDNFEGAKLDSNKWITKYYYGEKQLHKNYVMADDRHAFTEGKNLEFFDKKLRIVTKREASKTLVWDAMRGFYEKDCDFTSDMISTANHFNQKYGLIEAKVKVAGSGVTQAFSLSTDQILPHIDVFKYDKNRIFSGNYWKNGSEKGHSKSVSKTSGSRFTKDYFIYKLEWMPGKMTWMINDQVFKVQTQGLPENPMFLMFNSSLKEKANDEGLPSAMEIDWIRVYKMKE